MNKRQAMKFVYQDRMKRNRPPTETQLYKAQRLLLKRGFNWDMMTYKWKPVKEGK